MKRKIITCFSICLLAVLIARAQTSKNNGGQPKFTEAQASSIIKYGNQLVQFFNRNFGITKTIASIKNTYEDNKERLARNNNDAVRSLGSKNYLDIPNRNNAIPAAPATYPDKSVPQLFGDCEVILKKIKSNCEAIEKYLANKSFTTDNFSSTDKLMKEMEQQADSVTAKMRRAINRASKLSNDAEMVFLQKSPIKHLVIPMKRDLNAFKDILNDMETDLINSNADVAFIKQKLARLKELYDKNKVTEGKDFSKKDNYYKLDVYPNFYKGLLDAVAQAEKYLQQADVFAKAADTEKENLQQRMSQSQSNVLTYYNNAIDAYNTFIRN
jgi:hypothetical protein